MTARKPRIAEVFEDNPLVLMDRVEGLAGANIVQADITGITYSVWQHDSYEDAINAVNGTAVGAAGTALTVANVVFDTLQTDARWKENGGDAEGYNFRFTVPAARFPTGGKWNRVQVTFDPAATGEDDFKLIWIVEVKPINS